MKRKIVKKIGIFILSVTLLGTNVTWAYAGTAAKEEVVYVVTDSKGRAEGIYVVNIFDGGSITDYGDYSAVKMLTTGDEITQNEDEITFTSEAKKVYYEGTLKEKKMPWNMEIRYLLNGQAISAEELAGKSGALEIQFKVTKSDADVNHFYESYALQAAVTLDSNRCSGIEAEDATIANVGDKKQLTYTILPGKGIDTVIRTDVTDFEMEEISVNALHLNLNVEVDDEALKDKVTDLMEGVNKIDNGAKKVQNGAAALKTGFGSLLDGATAAKSAAGTLSSGAAGVKDGAVSMKQGAAGIGSGMEELQTGINHLDAGLSTLSGNSSTLNTSAKQFADGALSAANSQLAAVFAALGQQAPVLTWDNYTETLSNLIPLTGDPTGQLAALKQNLDQVLLFQAGVKSYTDGVDAAAAGTAELSTGAAALLSGVNELKTGAEALEQGAAALADGMSTYAASISGLLDGTRKLYEGTENLYGGTKELSAGTAKMHTETAEINVRIDNEIETMVGQISGDSTEVKSFVSNKNENVSSVQFVIKIAGVEKTEPIKEAPEEEKSAGFWSKLLALFGSNK